MSEDFYDIWSDDVTRIAEFVAKDFPDVDPEDLSQEMLLWLWEKKKFRRPSDAGAGTALFWLAKKTAGGYRKQGLTLSAQYAYRVSDLKFILESVFSSEDWSAAFIPEDSRDGAYDDKMSVYTDVAWAYDFLPEPYKRAIYNRYYYDTIPTDDVTERTLKNAIERLADILNTYSRGRRQREAISNARARATIQDQESSR